MSNLRLTGALLAVLCLASSASAQDSSGDLTANPVQPKWWQKLFGTKTTTKSAKAPKPTRSPAQPDTGATGNLLPDPPEIRPVGRDEALNAYFRRLEVYDRLMEVAVANNDPQLMQQAEELHKKIFDAYRSRTAELGGLADPTPKPGPTGDTPQRGRIGEYKPARFMKPN